MIPDEPDFVATPSETVGPFFHFGLATDSALGCVADRTAEGEFITVRFRITDANGTPVPDALVEIWQVDASGAPAVLPIPGGTPSFRGFGRMPTAEDGCCEFHTVRPGRMRDTGAGVQASHINVCLFARGLLRQIHTRLYFRGDPALADDPVLALVPQGRRETLLAMPDPENGSRWLFDIRLQGHDETVFFDV